MTTIIYPQGVYGNRPPGYVLPDDVDPPEPTEPWAALLPALDPATMGWSGRDWYLGPRRPHLLEDVEPAGVASLRRGADRLTEWLDGARPGARWNLPLPDGDRP